jgi:hypothetical protein
MVLKHSQHFQTPTDDEGFIQTQTPTYPSPTSQHKNKPLHQEMMRVKTDTNTNLSNTFNITTQKLTSPTQMMRVYTDTNTNLSRPESKAEVVDGAELGDTSPVHLAQLLDAQCVAGARRPHSLLLRIHVVIVLVAAVVHGARHAEDRKSHISTQVLMLK